MPKTIIGNILYTDTYIHTVLSQQMTSTLVIFTARQHSLLCRALY